MFDARKLLEGLIASASENANGLRENAQDLADKARENDLLGQAGEKAKDAFGQATDGVKDIAGQVDGATGASDKLDELVGQFSGGKSASELLEQAQGWMGENKLQTGAIIGGLGGLLLGTKSGRAITGGAAKIGALALIGGLAYKAYQNHQSGRPLLNSRNDAPEAAPAGTGFEAETARAEDAELYIQTMISAAAVDGHIDASERAQILGSINEAGLDQESIDYLEGQMANPASISQLASAVTSPEEKTKLYTAARLTIDPDTDEERVFLETLADALGLEQGLADHLNAEVQAIRAGA